MIVILFTNILLSNELDKIVISPFVGLGHSWHRSESSPYSEIVFDYLGFKLGYKVLPKLTFGFDYRMQLVKSPEQIVKTMTSSITKGLGLKNNNSLNEIQDSNSSYMMIHAEVTLNDNTFIGGSLTVKNPKAFGINIGKHLKESDTKLALEYFYQEKNSPNTYLTANYNKASHEVLLNFSVPFYFL